MKGPTLVCAATFDELQTLGLMNEEQVQAGKLWRIRDGYATVTGAGTPITLLRLIPLIQSLRPARIFNIGIAGAYPGSGLKIGDVAVGTSEVFADLGMETPDNQGFQPLSRFPFCDEVFRSPMPLWVPEWAVSTDDSLVVRPGAGATVNQCTGKDGTGRVRKELFNSDFESMEGAAVALAALEAKVPVCEIRAISNFASTREMLPGNIQLGLRSLAEFWKIYRSHLS